ncbi:MAG TPA: hypothetical protein V6C81_23635 [Planktothrix sp.]|jgi:hypothetical protein
MHAKRSFSRDYLGFFVITLGAALAMVVTHKTPATAEDEPKLDRALTLVVNLNKMEGSAGWYILQDIRSAKLIDHDLLKAHHQVEEVDHTYAKLRGRPDDKFLSAVTLKLEKAEATRAQLEEDLHDCFDQLRTSIQDVLVMDEKALKKKK